MPAQGCRAVSGLSASADAKKATSGLKPLAALEFGVEAYGEVPLSFR